jgi:hypothetical protein
MGGDVDGGCDGKNVWDDVVRTLILWILDVSVIEWDHHVPASLEMLKATLSISNLNM